MANKFDNNDSYGNERMKIGNKEVIIHGSRNNNNKHRERDRSRSNDSDINNHNNKGDNNYHMQKNNGRYYQQQPPRGMYPHPPMNMRFNSYYQQYPYGNYTYARPFFRENQKHSQNQRTQPQQQEQENKEEQKQEDNTNQQNTNNNNTQTEENVEHQQQETTKKKTRCRNWPNCKDANCEYTHPTTTVSVLLINIIYSVHISLIVNSEINVVTFIQIFHVNMECIVPELDAHILILQVGIPEYIQI